MTTSHVLNLTSDLKRNETWPLASEILQSRAEGTEKEMTHVICTSVIYQALCKARTHLMSLTFRTSV